MFLTGKRTIMNLSAPVLTHGKRALTGGDKGLCLGTGHPHDRGGGGGRALGLPGHLWGRRTGRQNYYTELHGCIDHTDALI